MSPWPSIITNHKPSIGMICFSFHAGLLGESLHSNICDALTDSGEPWWVAKFQAWGWNGELRMISYCMVSCRVLWSDMWYRWCSGDCSWTSWYEWIHMSSGSSEFVICQPGAASFFCFVLFSLLFHAGLKFLDAKWLRHSRTVNQVPCAHIWFCQSICPTHKSVVVTLASFFGNCWLEDKGATRQCSELTFGNFIFANNIITPSLRNAFCVHLGTIEQEASWAQRLRHGEVIKMS